MTKVCICGGGSLGHVVAGYLGAKNNVSVSILTRKPEKWQNEIELTLPDGGTITGKLEMVSGDAAEVIPQADIIILCLPGYAIKPELEIIAKHVTPGTFVGSVFSSTGFFFEALKIFNEDVPLWGFQRVPFIARTKEYGKSANLLGYKTAHNIAIENCKDKETFRRVVEELFDCPVRLMNNYYEVSFTNSNPILHPSRLYSLFCDWNSDVYYNRQFLFYEEWSIEASEYLIALDRELFMVIDKLPVSKGFLTPILEHYESTDAQSLANKLRSIEGFKNIKAPMIETEKGWQPNINDRYFREDFIYGLRYIYEKAKELKIETPTIDKIYNWGLNLIKINNENN